MQIAINKTGEIISGENAKVIVLRLSDMGIIPPPSTERYNPLMLLQGPIKNGLIKIIGGNNTNNFNNLKNINNNNIPSITHNIPSPEMQPTLFNGNNNNSNDLAATIAAALNPYIQQQHNNRLDEGRVIELIQENTVNIDPEMIREMVEGIAPRKIEIVTETRSNIIEGNFHPMFETLLKVCSLRLPAWLHGPAGSGKTTAASHVAKALSISFYTVSVCGQTTKTELLGYNDATGKYIGTMFYKAYSEGGVFLLDEIDNGNPNVLSVLNSALANGHCGFPCGIVEKHPDFILIAAGNTIGTGANIQYIGRNPIDSATLDRFTFINWKYDEELEYKLSGDKSWTDKIIELRKSAERKGLRCIISPRASINGAKMIATGMSEKEVMNLLIFNKMSESDKNTLMN